MNHSAIEQQSLSLTPEVEELTTPHFDDSAVATAHQVEPLPKRPAYRFGSSRYVLTLASAVVVGILLGISAVMISLAPRGEDPSPAVLAEASAQMDSLDESTAEASTDSSVARDSSASRQKSSRATRASARRTIDRYMAEEFSDDDDYSPRPAARRVGVIYSGRSRNNP